MRLIEISGNHRYLFADRGFLSVKSGDEQIARIPMDQILGVIGAGHGISMSQTLLGRLADRGIPYVICDASFSPVAVVWPLEGHHLQSRAIRNQLQASLPLQKRLWQSIIRQKITNQATALKIVGRSSKAIERLADKVRSGDTENCEAQAARIYWPMLLGTSFRRNREGQAPNTLLNYGYTIIRSAMARAVAGCGLHPSVSLCHSNQFNPFVLIDDLIEPFRPFVDLRVHALHQQEQILDQSAKASLVETLHKPCSGPENSSSLLHQIQALARSLSSSFDHNEVQLSLPQPSLVEWQAFAEL